AHILSLPNSEIGVLDGQGRQLRRRILDERFVERREFAQEDHHRPTIRDDVVQREKKNVLFFRQLEKLCPQQRTAREVKWLLDLLGRNPHSFGLGGFRRKWS